ncbi:MAG: hypothetical protein E7410_00900 [Ruminococcaceae bacterium]|nr:hypothetical protein [Oscillospiraceae bacterium]
MGEVANKKSCLKLGKPLAKQEEFFCAKERFVAYGGARGGGKSWAARTKAVMLALAHSGIQILFLRRTLSSLRENHIYPLKKLLKNAAVYKSSTREFVFANESRIVLGYCSSEDDVLQYQGQGYDVIFMEEATQFSEFQYQALTESNRSSGLCKTDFEPRMYLTCNPGGVGHGWVKRLFIDRNYRQSEEEGDYRFIKSLVYDNDYLLKYSPGYVKALENLPKARRMAMLDGNWDVFDGQYFDEFNRDVHVIKPFVIPSHWRRFISIDYGLDMLACLWIALDDNGKAYVYKELYEKGLIISDAAKRIHTVNGDDEILMRFAPPDMWNRRQETGKSAADIFLENGLYFYKSNNNRVQGWYEMKEWLKPYSDEQGITTAKLVIFENCVNLIRTLPSLRFDEKNPNDVANEPHELTHAPDALRCFICSKASSSKGGGQMSEQSEGYESFLEFGV